MQVSVRERQLAERQYLKEYAQEWMESQADESKRLLFSQQHPRFATLVKGMSVLHNCVCSGDVIVQPNQMTISLSSF